MPFALIPFLLLLFGLALVLVCDLFKPNPNRSYRLSLFTVAAATISQLFALGNSLLVSGGQVQLWKPIEQVLQFDVLSQCFSLLVLILTFLSLGISRKSFDEEERCSGEYYALFLTAALGAVIVAHAEELLSFFLAFEMLSIPLYVLVGFRRYHRKSSEAGLKYFLSGALSSAVFLFGASWIFGATGTTNYYQIAKELGQGHQQPLVLGLLMVIGAFAFKMAAAPFHMWAPDAYEGSPIPVTAFLSSVPKVAMLAASIRLFLALTDILSYEIMIILAALAILSIILGNLVALTQRELTRLMAYSGVAQIGYLFIGLSALVGLEGAGRPDLAQGALGSLFFYLIIYTITNLALWIILLTVSKSRGSTQLDAFNGLSESSPFLAMSLLVAVFSLAGVPPLAGFVGKLYLFRAAFYSQPLMAVFGVIGSVISLYYYFNILRRCYFLRPASHQDKIELSVPTRLILIALLALTLTGGLIPNFAKTCFYLAERMLII